jgi:predicted enzyme related to lactoylglutathione lyase
MAKNCICHVEWSTTDLEQEKAFLWGLFGWEFQPFSESYMLFSAEGGMGGGIMKVERVQAGQSPTVYVEVEAIEPFLEQVVELGGSVAVPKSPIPGMGWFAHIADFDGNVFGLFQSE